MAVESAEQYCRAIEAYLCRKNDGHLIRIVGPAFEQVLSWAVTGVPIRIAYHGIDRYFERYYAKGPRRRPVRIEFCEADVLDAFDEWRRAIGITHVPPGAAASSDDTDRDGHAHHRHESLPAHLDRVVARLTALRAGDTRSLDAILETVIRELDAGRVEARSLRGSPRREFLDRLRAIDGELLAEARRQCDAATLAQLTREADDELAPFRDRLPGDAFEQSRHAAIDRLVRERCRLPIVAFD